MHFRFQIAPRHPPGTAQQRLIVAAQPLQSPHDDEIQEDRVDNRRKEIVQKQTQNTDQRDVDDH